MGIKGWSGQGCTHQGPLLAYTTICCPGRAPMTRPAMVSTLSRPPCAAGGILLNSMDGWLLLGWELQPVRRSEKTKRTLPRVKLFNARDVAVFSFHRLHRRRRTRLGKGAKRANSNLGTAESSIRDSIVERAQFGEPAHPTTAARYLLLFEKHSTKRSSSPRFNACAGLP